MVNAIAALCLGLGALVIAQAEEQTAEITAQAIVNRSGSAEGTKPHANDGVVLWLTPVNDTEVPPPVESRNHDQLAQKNKQFVPRFLVVQVGSLVYFPNLDPFFHNVFSYYNGKKFDLGLYESGSTRSVRFNRPGVSYIFCNIHPEMSAVVVAVPTPYFAVSTTTGSLVIHDVAPGTYEVHVWALGSSDSSLAALSHRVTVSRHSVDLGMIQVTESASGTHKNKFGEDYDEKQPPYEP